MRKYIQTTGLLDIIDVYEFILPFSRHEPQNDDIALC